MTSLLRAAAGWIVVGCAGTAACALVGYDFDGYTDCDDMNLCTTDVCSSGYCGHVFMTMDDANACTADGCDPSTGPPTHTPIDDCCPHSVCTAACRSPVVPAPHSIHPEKNAPRRHGGHGGQ